MRNWARRTCALLAAIFLVMWVPGLRFYTSVGWDAERTLGDRVQSNYYRLRWTGDGDIWLGGGSYVREAAQKPIERFDLASAFFQWKKERPIPRSWWNRLGFWNIDEEYRLEESEPPITWERWFGVPGWLPVIVLGAWPVAVSLRHWFWRQK